MSRWKNDSSRDRVTQCLEEMVLQSANVHQSGSTRKALKLDFEQWVELLQETKICRIVGCAPQRVLWSAADGPFDCADYFTPQDRLTTEQKTVLFHVLAHQPDIFSKVEHLISIYLITLFFSQTNRLNAADLALQHSEKKRNRLYQKDTLGYLVEFVQLLGNKNILRFKKGGFAVW